MEENRIFYLCDRLQCKKCHKYCNHTAKKEHAKNYKNREVDVLNMRNFYKDQNGDFWEIKR